ncbi:DUF3322 domain-containing protein [Pseudomonas aeruginosa]
MTLLRSCADWSGTIQAGCGSDSWVRVLSYSLLLKPPTGSQALEDLDHFHGYIAAWRKWPWPHQVAWVTKRFRQLGECEVR